MTRESIIEQVKGLDSFTGDKFLTYKLSHTYEIEPTPIYVKSKIAPDTMNLLIAYIQFEGAEIKEEYGLGQEEVVPLLTKYFDVEVVSERKRGLYNIDLYENWEIWCGVADKVMELDFFKSNKENLINDLKSVILH
jgi:hypothetical protein